MPPRRIASTPTMMEMVLITQPVFEPETGGGGGGNAPGDGGGGGKGEDGGGGGAAWAGKAGGTGGTAADGGTGGTGGGGGAAGATGGGTAGAGAEAETSSGRASDRGIQFARPDFQTKVEEEIFPSDKRAASSSCVAGPAGCPFSEYLHFSIIL